MKKDINTSTHPSYHRMLKLSPENAILTSICKSFVIEDEEFYKHPQTQANKHNPDFWIDLGQHVSMILHGHLTTVSMQKKTAPIPLMDYLMCQRYRGELIDVIIPAVEQYLNGNDSEEMDD